MSINKVILLGNSGKDPETREINGKKLSKFSLATSEKYNDKEYTSWHNIEAWGKTAEIVELYVKKGSQVLVIGKIKYDE